MWVSSAKVGHAGNSCYSHFRSDLFHAYYKIMDFDKLHPGGKSTLNNRVKADYWKAWVLRGALGQVPLKRALLPTQVWGSTLWGL